MVKDDRRHILIPIEKIKNFEIGHNFVQRDSRGMRWIGKKWAIRGRPARAARPRRYPVTEECTGMRGIGPANSAPGGRYERSVKAIRYPQRQRMRPPGTSSYVGRPGGAPRDVERPPASYQHPRCRLRLRIDGPLAG